MDQTEKFPCIIQALRAATSPSPISTVGSNPRFQSQPSAVGSGRCTRSQAAPDWSAGDTLALIEQIAAVDTEAWSRPLSSFQKWKIIAANCAQLGLGLNRPANQCKRRWEILLADYVRIRRWETRGKSLNGAGWISYWILDPISREKHGLPGSFSLEVYTAMDAVVKVESDSRTARSAKDVDSELLSVGPVDDLDADVALARTDLDAGENLGPDKILAWEIAVRLKENAERVENMIKIGERETENKCGNSIESDVSKKVEGLSEVIGDLVRDLDRFSEVIKANGFENVVV